MKNLFYLFVLLPAIAFSQARTDLAKKEFILKRFFEKNHYQPRLWNDSSSSMLFTHIIEELDEEKHYFQQQDIDALSKYKFSLDEELNTGNSSGFLPALMQLYKLRVQYADSLTQALLAKPFDYTKQESFFFPAKNYPENNAQHLLRIQQSLKKEILDDIIDRMEDDSVEITAKMPAKFSVYESEEREKLKKSLKISFKRTLQNPTVFQSEMEKKYLDAIAWCYDPHSNYFNSNDKSEFETLTSASEYNAGFAVEEDDKGEKKISQLTPGGSAWRSGKLHKGDILEKIKVDGIEYKIDELTKEQLEKFFDGNTHPQIEITVRTASGQLKTIELLQEKTEDEDEIVKSYVLGDKTKVAYIKLPGFYSNENEDAETIDDLNYKGCANDLSKELIKLKHENVSGLVLDLRLNGGGSMWEAIQLAGVFIDIGPIASVKDPKGKVTFMKDPNRGTIFDGPMIILVNSGSASASEFLASALQDYNRALIVGSNTYGKGTGQVVLPLDTSLAPTKKDYQDFVKITETKFYRINGNTVQWKGVVPDIELPDVLSEFYPKERDNASALTPDESKKGTYQPYKPIPVETLLQKSRQRTLASEYFKSVTAVSKLAVQLKQGTIIPLQWAQYANYHNSLYAAIGKEKQNGEAEMLTITNNNKVDVEKLLVLPEAKKKENTSILKEISSDFEVAEAYNIMIDWLNLLH